MCFASSLRVSNYQPLVKDTKAANSKISTVFSASGQISGSSCILTGRASTRGPPAGGVRSLRLPASNLETPCWRNPALKSPTQTLQLLQLRPGSKGSILMFIPLEARHLSARLSPTRPVLARLRPAAAKTTDISIKRL